MSLRFGDASSLRQMCSRSPAEPQRFPLRFPGMGSSGVPLFSEQGVACSDRWKALSPCLIVHPQRSGGGFCLCLPAFHSGSCSLLLANDVICKQSKEESCFNLFFFNEKYKELAEKSCVVSFPCVAGVLHCMNHQPGPPAATVPGGPGAEDSRGSVPRKTCCLWRHDCER